MFIQMFTETNCYIPIVKIIIRDYCRNKGNISLYVKQLFNDGKYFQVEYNPKNSL